ncbi:MAG: TonB C-terminal domain-containing protein [Acidobacteriota bacterium]
MPAPVASFAAVPSARVPSFRFSLGHGLGVALLLHLLILLWISLFPQLFSVRPMVFPEPPHRPPPLKFTFMDLPDEHVVKKNPEAEMTSDKAREESGPVPSVTTPEGKLPPAKGNTREKIVAVHRPPAPTRPVPSSAPEIEPKKVPTPPPPRKEMNKKAEVSPKAGGGQDEPPPAPVHLPRTGDEAAPSSGAGRKDPKQAQFSRALDSLAAQPLPTDLEAFTPPARESMLAREPSHPWTFDNPNPAFPVKIGTISFDSKGADFGPWLREFHARVLNEWSRNLDAWHRRVWNDVIGAHLVTDSEKMNRYAMIVSRVRGVTGVDFIVTREGSVVRLRMVHPSGNQELDRSVQKTLRNVLLPPLPADYPDETLLIRAGFYYNVEPPP